MSTISSCLLSLIIYLEIIILSAKQVTKEILLFLFTKMLHIVIYLQYNYCNILNVENKSQLTKQHSNLQITL